MDNKGFTYSSVLVNIIISLFLLPIIVSSLRVLANIRLEKLEIQNEIGLVQLRRDLLYAYDLKPDLNQLDFVYKGEQCSLIFNNSHLYRTPGTVIYLEDIDYAVFETDNENIYLIYYTNDHEYKRVIY